MKKIKVLHVIEGLGSGGAERLLHTNLKNLNQELFESEVVTVFSGSDFWKPQIESLGISVESLNCGRFRKIPSAVIKLRKYIELHRPDIIHTHLWAANIVGRIAGYLAGVPVISSIHNPEYEDAVLADGFQLNRVKLLVARLTDKWTAHVGCKHMIAVSKYAKQSTGKWLKFPAERISVIYNPIDTSDLHVQVQRSELLTALNLPDSATLLVNVGRITPQKGLLYAIRAMPKILSFNPNTFLLSIGGKDDSEWTSVIENEIQSLDLAQNVFLLGERRDVNDFLKACDIFLFPSLYEGLGIALGEAMAMSRPCVTNDISPLNEFVTHDFDGVLLPTQNPKAISDSVVDLMRNDEKRKKLGDNANQTAFRVFAPEPAVAKLSALYNAVVTKTYIPL